MIQTHGLTHIQITVRDLERSLRFYQSLFGMKELFRAGAHAVMLQTPGTKEVFTINANPALAETVGAMGGIAHFGFRLREKVPMEKLLTEAASYGATELEHGVRGQGEKEEPWAFFKDPDGYTVEVFWAP
jgi:catechol 2,3-dioxygenase-like lactoylglutathione lyase family enzyme